MAMVTVNGTQLYHELTGASSIAVVLVHGSWGDHHNWDAVVPPLARSFRVLTYDRRGHSRSAPPTTQGSLREDSVDLAALIEALGLAPVHVVGNSFGASIALRLASERPELFRSLTAHEPPLFGLLAGDPAAQAPLAALEQRVSAVIELLRAGDAATGARQFVETIAFGPGVWDTLPEAMRQTLIANAPTWLDEALDPEWASLDRSPLGRLVQPALLTRGDQSPPLFAAVMAQLAPALPHAAQHVFAGAGHAPHLTQPAAYVDVVAAFIAGASTATSHPAH